VRSERELIAPALLAARGISKGYGGVEALAGVDFDVFRGEVVGLVGDNGAGKSTLVRILAGNEQPDSGRLSLEGTEVRLRSPSDARTLGVEAVYQDLALCEDLDATANLYLGREVRQTWLARSARGA